MSFKSMDATELEILPTLDGLVSQRPVRKKLDSIAARLLDRLRDNDQVPLVWEPVSLALYGESVPLETRSSWVFVLRANSESGAEKHPNSIQRVMSYRGSADLQTRPNEDWIPNRLISEPSAPLEKRWLSIPAGVWHQGVMGADHWVVVSFHTVPADELIEERPTVEGSGTLQRRYLD